MMIRLGKLTTRNILPLILKQIYCKSITPPEQLTHKRPAGIKKDMSLINKIEDFDINQNQNQLPLFRVKPNNNHPAQQAHNQPHEQPSDKFVYDRIDQDVQLRNCDQCLNIVQYHLERQSQAKLIKILKKYVKASEGQAIKSKLSSQFQKYTQRISPTNKNRKQSAELQRAERQFFAALKKQIYIDGINSFSKKQELTRLISECNPNLLIQKYSQRTSRVETNFEADNDKNLIQAQLYEETINSRSENRIQRNTNASQRYEDQHQNTILQEQQEEEEPKKQKTKKSQDLKLHLKKQVRLKQSIAPILGSIASRSKKIIPVFQCRVQPDLLSKRQSQSWIYCFNLPYEFSQADAEQLIYYLSTTYGPIKKYEIEQRKHFLGEHLFLDKVYELQDSIDYELDEKLTFQLIKNEAIQHAGKKKPKGSDWHSHFQQKMMIQQKNRFNRSTMLFNFENLASKQKFLSSDMRLCGLNLGKLKNIRFQQGSSKKVVNLINIPWGCSSQDLILNINQKLNQIGIPLQIPSEQYIITQKSAFIRFSCMLQAKQCADALNGHQFQSNALKSQLVYGQCKMHKGQLIQYLTANNKDELKARLLERQNYYEQMRKKV